MMPHSQKHQQYKLQDERKTQALVDGQVPAAEEVDTTAAASSTLMPGTPDNVPAATPRTPSLPKSLQKSSSSTARKATPSSKSNKGSRGQVGKHQSTSQARPYPEFLLTNILEKKVIELVKFLSVKYATKELVTEVDMVKNVIREHKDDLPEIFKNACEWMRMIFGIDVKQVDPISHSYVLVKALELTYDGRLSEDQCIPKTGLLILVLGIIFMEGNCAPEEKIWEMLQKIGVYPEKKDFICANPRKFITKELVQERYLKYRQIPNSDPARYEFLWGPRAYAETTKMKILEFFSNAIGSSPTDFPSLYREALRDEEEKAQPVTAAEDCTTAPVGTQASTKHSSSGPQ
ncbi:putative MAGE domain-containing protein MAGEA13P [Fukomys damarensis]|nr:putative MAGE domain-containing protein MAGEA13P [Fukomys damarensis]XP_010638824.1 putative MAGE domain-containing protein MAGEA13P [Fukomys damarensis]XP_010638825.1 putative MAGE domain-containing protein MAGEA13P [Fukomys damarensis]XP_010638826.1 putative MAGE domain-containing protein MAGEA13P [Fukomys damarensis]XP_010638827.1 putative MAGE domain-containing protein MAGEA13P [Fukomys damarensis]XP_010638828.1 putative MAGE domain-containing protein MAGEA13P [Fukomys damarensis]XP_01